MIWNNLKNKTLYLASQSPRRMGLLRDMGLTFETCIANLDESYPEQLKGPEIPSFLAEMKSNYFATLHQEENIVITADTIVWLHDRALNKPADEHQALEMLNNLSGNTHEVYTGLCVNVGKKRWSFVDRTEVTFKTLTQAEMLYYIEHYHPFDKAGSYGAQDFIGLIGIEKLQGSYFNVMGLPTHRLYEILREI